ncbi:hypothetical protein BDZ89DRAFT_888863, partial [Hymenopellis radicata]
DDDDDTRVEVEYKGAGVVVQMDESLHHRWRDIFGDPDGDIAMEGQDPPPSSNIYAPFASELDWRVAQWVVKDGIGHNSFDRLLKIPGV